MAEHSYKFLNALGQVRTVRTTIKLGYSRLQKLEQVVSGSPTPQSHTPETWGEIILIYGVDDRDNFRVAGLTVAETASFVVAIGHHVKDWELRDDMGLCMKGAVMPSGPDFSWMDRARAV